MTSLLILSFSPIASDARVMKQVREFASDFEVTTCGYGPAPAGVADHVRIPDDVLHNVLHDGRIVRKAYRRAYWTLWSVKWARAHLRRRRFDIVLANDVEAVPLALALSPRRGVHADLHEYSPLLNEDWEGWREKITPYVEWLCSEYVSGADSWSTVSQGIADEYARRFGFHAEVVTNAAPYQSFDVEPTRAPIRAVHSGAALADRKLEIMIDAVGAIPDMTFDLYLTPNQPAYVDQLRERAAAFGDRIRVHDPVPYAELAATLHRFDLGLFALPPTTFNYRWALPNKLFDFIQARLGVVVTPNPEMERVVRETGTGWVASGFEVQDFATALGEVSAPALDAAKHRADSVAAALGADAEIAKWRAALERIAGRR